MKRGIIKASKNSIREGVINDKHFYPGGDPEWSEPNQLTNSELAAVVEYIKDHGILSESSSEEGENVNQTEHN